MTIIRHQTISMNYQSLLLMNVFSFSLTTFTIVNIIFFNNFFLRLYNTRPTASLIFWMMNDADT
uniref:Uncharacterized protein n=1 Tax=Kuenenia stuttgartiensis TaxID=174633 RepID=Q1Q2C2_KUEST|nr:unknown protein [Candidatus Kuenenia stuttgartiensis]